MDTPVFFFVGTEAELIKVFSVMLECKKRGIDYKIIASGQNNIVDSRIFKKSNCGKVDFELSKESSIKKSTSGLFQWFIRTYRGASKKIANAFPGIDYSNAYMIVHGDTISTFMGARIGKELGMTVCHIEAGLRSHNLLSPFPEEIDRILTSRCASIHFAPGQEPADNLSKAKGKVVNTIQNTLIDSLNYSLLIPVESDIQRFLNEDYFVFVMHRQENLLKKDFVTKVVNKIIKAAETRKCVVILHEITKNAFEKFGLMEMLQNNPNMILQPRVDYFDFMKVLNNSQYVITDGGSNQEELYYMGKPCLIMRKTTERKEGLGKNAKLYGGDLSAIDDFINNYQKMAREVVKTEISPSSIIVDKLIGEDCI